MPQLDGKQALGPDADLAAETAAVDPGWSLPPHLGPVIISHYDSVIVQNTLYDLTNRILTRFPDEPTGAVLT